MSAIKVFVLDTNILLYNPDAIFVFEENQIIIPEVVLEELNKFKWERSERGANARRAGHLLDELRLKGSLVEGVEINSDGGKLKVELNYTSVDIPKNWVVKDNYDNRILQICMGLKFEHKNVVLVSKDILLRVKASSLEIPAQDYNNDKVESTYTGREVLYGTREDIDNLYSKSELELENVAKYDNNGNKVDFQLYNNQFVIVQNSTDPKHSALTYFDGKKLIKCSLYNNKSVDIISPRNIGQRMLMEALLKTVEDGPLVVCKGPAGTGKTLLALSVALNGVYNGEFRKVLILRPSTTMDEEIGFLPGGEKEKIDPFLRPIYDNLEVIVDSNEKLRYKDEKQLKGKVQYLFDKNIIEAQSVGFMRGRSVAKQFVIVDEAQNLTPLQAKGLITRAGEGTKIVLLGDVAQIDKPFLDKDSNGLSFAFEKMKNSKLCWNIALNEEESERSELAREASKLL